MKRCFGEFLGTFLLVLFGCGSVMVATAYQSHSSLFQIAALWGLGLTVAIMLSGPISGAHLNPAVSLAFATRGRLPWRELPAYLGGQFAGAFAAAAVLQLQFGPDLLARDPEMTVLSARCFGEFFDPESVSLGRALGAEVLGTALLTLAIFGYNRSERDRHGDFMIPLWVGLTLTVLIALFAPVSQAGFNPARDLAPRLFSYWAGWGELVFSFNGSGWFIVYVLGPILGGQVGAGLAYWYFDRDKRDQA